jgi:hypothetical protein
MRFHSPETLARIAAAARRFDLLLILAAAARSGQANKKAGRAG